MRKDFDPSAPIARHEMALGLTSLFRALPDGARRQEVVLEQRFGGWSIRVMGPELSAFEQGIFFALLEIARRNEGRQITAQAAGLLPPPGRKAGVNLAANAPALRFTCTVPDLLSSAGYASAHETGGGTREALERSLQRLSCVTVAATNAQGDGGVVNLMLARWSGGDLEISLNPRSAAALLALRSYAAINMRTYNSLATPTAKVFYAWLCSWFGGAGGERLISLDKAESHIFGGLAKARSTRSKRRAAIHDAAQQITKSRSFEIHCGHRTIRCRRAVDILPPSGEHLYSEKRPV
ncbi:MAG: replication protein C, IncQ-type [Thiomonas sp.]|uniref:replication protein C, IncQ-type n=1 Tax=Thiomonas sp. TaxID=2047785 RepID=UPI002A370802|nr:replication protein C, IncQ-type [Thiomonas sp.]MDY0331127.1 replication protein C, IncQ-type [Thiomonas sp.]